MHITFNLSDIINDLLRQSHLSVDPLVGELIAAFILFAVSLIIGWIVYTVFERVFSRWAKKTKSTIDDEIIRNVKTPIYFLVIVIGSYTALQQLSILRPYNNLILFIYTAIEILLIAFIITRVINVLVSWYAEKIEKKQKRVVSKNILIVFKKLLHAVVYIFAFVAILYVSKIDLSGALVGLGVGGIAIAFALQSILADAFSAFSIYFDRPFEIGDFIIVGEHAGTVTHISMKSTRIQLLQGEELVLSNKTILERSIRNFKKLKKRRVVFSIGVTYDTHLQKIKKIPDMIRKIIENVELTEVERIHFKEFGPYSLNYEVVYHIDTSDYNKYMDIQHAINVSIMDAFEKEGIEFAFPTQTIFLAKNTSDS